MSYLLRPAREDDLDAVMDLADLTGFGLTTLPRDRELLQDRIHESINSFKKIIDQPGGETYLFILENSDGDAVGTCAIMSKVGGFEPFYTYRIDRSVHESEVLNVHKEIPTLHLVEEHDGPTEIGSLFLHPDVREHGIGRFLSLSRFVFMAQYPDLFEEMVIAEMRGKIDEEGNSTFWEAVGRHFFDVDLPTADFISMKDKRIIAELMPNHPIYLPLLPKSAQDVIGQVHSNTEPALKILQDEGFEFAGMVDIFEAGPLVACQRESIRTALNSRETTVHNVVESLDEDLYVVARIRGDRSEYCASPGPVQLTDDGAILEQETAEILRVTKGDSVRVSPLYPSDDERASDAPMGMYI